MKIYVHRKTCMRLFTASLFIRIKIWKQLKYSSVGEWMHGRSSPLDGMLTAITRNRVGYTLNTSESCKHYERSQTQKVYLLYSSISLSFWKGKPWGQKRDQSLPGTGSWEGGWATKRHRGIFRQKYLISWIWWQLCLSKLTGPYTFSEGEFHCMQIMP